MNLPERDVFPKEVLELLEELEPEKRAPLTALAQAMALPAPPALRQAAQQAVQQARELSAEALGELLSAAESEARASLAAEVARLEASQAGKHVLSPPAAAILALDGSPSLVESLGEEQARLQTEVARARTLLDAGADLAPLLKAVERARHTARFFPPWPGKKMVSETGRALGEPGAVIEVLNAAYYRVRGQGIYEDFQTLVGADPTLGQADAVDFANRVAAAEEAGAALPETFGVVETGIGSGRFAQSFLDALSECAPAIYARTRYYLCDLSESMLASALAQDGLAKHAEVVTPLVSNGIPRELPDGCRPLFCRSFELFDDLPRTDLMYRDPAGQVFRLVAHAVVWGEEPLQRVGEGEVDPGDALRWLSEGDVDQLGQLKPGDLTRLDWEGRFEPFEGDLADGLPPDLLFCGERDVLAPLPHGGTDALFDALHLLHPELGWLRLSDYGIVQLGPANRTLSALSQVSRRYGASITLDVHFPLLAALAGGLGWQPSIAPVSAVVGRAMGARVCPIPPYYARFGAANLLRDVSGPTPLLRLEQLAAFEAIAARAAELETAEREQAFAQLVGDAEREGWLRPGLPLHDPDPALPLLEALALELDFVVNAVFVRHGTPALASGREWYAPHELAHIIEVLAAIGWPQERVERAIEGIPERVRFWTLTVSR